LTVTTVETRTWSTRSRRGYPRTSDSVGESEQKKGGDLSITAPEIAPAGGSHKRVL
jgi:hypothetical protein